MERSLPVARGDPAPNTIRNVGGMDQHVAEEALSIDQDVACAPIHLLRPVVAAALPFSVVFTLWLSMMPALGVGSRPARPRTPSCKALLMRSQLLSRRYNQK